MRKQVQSIETLKITWGKFGKGKANSSGIRLLKMSKKFDLFLTNTIFNHKLSHRTTWTATYRNLSHMMELREGIQ